MSQLRYIAVALGIALSLCAGAAWSQPRPPTTAAKPELSVEVRTQAADAFQEALRAFLASDFETARERYEEAYRLAPHPNTLYNLALSCERLLDYDAAISAFQRFLDEPLPADPQPAQLQQTRRLLAERTLRRLRSLPARVSISAVPDSVTASVLLLDASGHEVTDADGTVSLRGHDTTPCIFTLPAGRYRLMMEREGYFPEQVDFDAHVGQAMLFSRQLRPRPRHVTIESQPQAHLFMDDRALGETPYSGDIPLGNHRLRLERRFHLTQIRPLDLAPGAAPLRFRIGLELSGRADMIIGGALAGAGLGLMVLRLFLGEEIETLPRQEIYKPLAAALLPAVLGASVAGFAGWEMPIREAQLLIGSAGWGSLIGFGLGLGAQPQGPLPHVMAIGGGLVGGTLGTAAYRFYQPSSGTAAVFNSAALWSSIFGALGWAYLISDHPQTAFYGQPSTGRTGEGGWLMFGTALAGVGLGIAVAQLPFAHELSRSQVALVDLGGMLGGLSVGALGMGITYLSTGSWVDTAHVAVPCTLAGIGVGLITSGIVVHIRRQRQRLSSHSDDREPSRGLLQRLQSGPPQLSLAPDIGGGVSIGVGIMDGRF